MKYKTLFRVMLKLIGVSVVVGGINGTFGQFGYALYVLTDAGARSVGGNWLFIFNLLAPALQIGIGLYLFFGGKWIVDKAIPGNRPTATNVGMT